MYKLNFKKRVWIVKQYLNGVSTSKIALAQNISRMSVSNLVRDYNQYGWDGLKDHKTGRAETVLNQTAVIVILDLRKRFGYGACHIEQIFKKKGFQISHRQIEKVLLRNNMVFLILKSKSRENGLGMNFRTQTTCGIPIGRMIHSPVNN